MYNKIEDYINQLKQELKDRDPALIQDALFDAEEHFRSALEESRKSSPDLSEAEALSSLIEKYGTPSEVASAYQEIETRMPPTLAKSKPQATRPAWKEFFGVFLEGRAWGAFLYLLLAGLFGSIYGLWTMAGTSFSLIFLILIIGLPFTGLFLLSLRGIALLEGRIVEALLGTRMPRRPIFVQKGLSWGAKLKALLTESYTWKVWTYLILQFPLGMLYTGITILAFGFSLKCALYPFWYWVLNRPLLNLDQPLYPAEWLIPIIAIAGIFLLATALHIFKAIGNIHGRYAKFMLVRKQ